MIENNADPVAMLNLARVNGGEALGRLLQFYRNYLMVLARVQVGRRLQRKIDAPDLVQDTFLKAYDRFHQFRGETEAEFMAWLREILGSAARDVLRRYFGAKQRDARLERELLHDIENSSEALQKALADSDSTPSKKAARREEAVLFANALNRLPQPPRLSHDALARLLTHSWPGNVRELEHTVIAAATMATGPEINATDLRLPAPDAAAVVTDFSSFFDLPFSEAKEKLIDAFERSIITAALSRHAGNVSAAARQLGIHRQSLQQKMAQLDIIRMDK